MKKLLNLLFYNECPCCHKRGIFVIGKIGYRYNTPFTCKYCDEMFKVESFSSMLLLTIIIVVGIIIAKVTKTDFIGAIILIVIFEYILERFIPFEHIDKKK